MNMLSHTVRNIYKVSGNLSTISLRNFTVSSYLQGPTVAVIYGTEIHEATAILANLSRAGADIQCYAPDEKQMHVVDHIKGAPDEKDSRNVLVESARIARGNVKPLSELTSSSADAVIFPGGFGAAKNLSDFAVNGPNMTVKPDVERVIKDFHTSKKPIGLCCIAPMLAAKTLGPVGVKITLGKSDDGSGNWPNGGSLEAAKALGANPIEKGVDEIVVDETKQSCNDSSLYVWDRKISRNI
ncbi:ES1-like protein, mitochondrial [Armadillidium nasatum]|uniref:ES1-like protein, mitochondrial n=1 Tax=Armadillidium nasatum TaxID=96803 RepID=A0A5N5SXE5_9CRUS|nr:ES1-like protein, mitochondrial [Armadillidium nasatum]